jgi:hypothetical protein
MSMSEEKKIAGELSLVQRDRRADGGDRHVRVTRGDILIARHFGGVAMMIAAPVRGYRGVGLDVRPDPHGAIFYRLLLVHADADLDVTLGETCDVEGAHLAWAQWAGWFALARLALDGDDWIAVESTPANRSRDVYPHRRGASMSKRRPRFGLRRKPGDPMRATPSDEAAAPPTERG